VSAGSTESAIALAVERWAQIHPFDLEPHLWETLFAEHRAGDILYAISKTKHTRDTRPEVIYTSLLHWLKLLEKPRVTIS
jgi:hypothetical protein